MKFHVVSRVLAAVAAISLAACGGGGGSNVTPPYGPPVTPTLTSNFVGVGDSLTAGYQSEGWLGAPPGSVANPLAAGTPFAALGVPPGQESGFWAQMWMQMNGASAASYAALANPATSVLPLIAGPGLSDQIVPANPALTGGVPFGQLPTRSSCDSFNQAAYTLSGVQTVRENPSAGIRDFGVPGMTLHEVATMTQPISPSCVPIPGANAVVQGLQALLSESGSFYPVLAGFNGGTQLSAAISVKPTLATVLIGANDILHFEFSGGTFLGVDGINGNTAQVQKDMTTIITGLQGAGAKVIVGNLPNILVEPFFMSVAPLPNQAACSTVGALQTYFACVLTIAGVPYATADGLRAQLATAYGLNAGASGSNPAINGGYGYITLGGTITVLKALGAGQTPNLDPNGPGSGNGSEYTTPALAAATQALNDTINSGIAAAASATQVPMVDLRTFSNDIATGCASGCASDPLALLALGGINPPVCCSETFGGGLVSFDGLHPSNTGYALMAEAFIQAANAAYKAGIPDLNVKAQHDGTGTIPFHDPYAQ